jgi:hypothetical protein
MHPGAKLRNEGNEGKERRLSPVVDHPHRSSHPKQTFFTTTATNASRTPIGPHRTTLLFKRENEKMGSWKTSNARHNIPTHPNPFDVLSEPHLPYHDFIPGTDTKEDEKSVNPVPNAQHKTPTYAQETFTQAIKQGNRFRERR